MLLDLAIPKEIIEVCRDTCIGVFIAALLSIEKKKKITGMPINR